MPSLLREKAVKDQPYPVNEEDLADKLRGPGKFTCLKILCVRIILLTN
jgi:hypothetical protein